jgi:hypothetical protein
MEAKKLLKKHLDIHIPKGEYRSEKQLIQLRYDASIGAINEALNIHSVVKSSCPACKVEHTENDCDGYCTAACLQGC